MRPAMSNYPDDFNQNEFDRAFGEDTAETPTDKEIEKFIREQAVLNAALFIESANCFYKGADEYLDLKSIQDDLVCSYSEMMWPLAKASREERGQ
jgi:hypothetical protein